MTFWDFCAPFYDFAEKRNGQAYGKMLDIVRSLVPQGASVLDVAAGTGSISLAASNNATSVLCTDISERMLAVAKKKAAKRGVSNIAFGNLNIFDTGKPDNAFDVVIAGQVLHLIDKPEKAAAELRRVARYMVILPLTLTKDLRGISRAKIRLWQLFGFSPKREFDEPDYKAFIESIGFAGAKFIMADGEMPMCIAVWGKEI
jgi:ubiquinone/menaquinone biosynthesis C-methylase UbiE